MKHIALIFLFCCISCHSQIDIKHNNKEDLNLALKSLVKKTDSLDNKLNQYKSSSESVIEVVDKVDTLYNNNFNRFIIFWGIVATIIIGGVPYYITSMQKKILEAKKAEFISFSREEILRLERDLNFKLQEKYGELSDLINKSNDDNKENLKKEFIRSSVNSLYIASKINEIDKNYDQVFNNLYGAINKSYQIADFGRVTFYLKQVNQKFEKFTGEGIQLNKPRLADISKELSKYSGNEEIDQEVLNKSIELTK